VLEQDVSIFVHARAGPVDISVIGTKPVLPNPASPAGFRGWPVQVAASNWKWPVLVWTGPKPA